MTDDLVVWNRLAALLPEAEAQEVRDCWDIGEQEAGLGLLVSGVHVHRVAVSETVRAQISVLAETWGEREALTPRIRQCRGDGLPADVELVERDGDTVGGATIAAGQDLADLVLVPWIACARCDQVLMRAHTQEPWGDLSYLAHHYAIVSPDRSSVLRLFPAGSAPTAFAALLYECVA